MSSLGELYFALGLDDKKFNDAIDAAKKKVAELNGSASIENINIDAAKIAEQIKSELGKLQGSNKSVGTEVDVKINEDSLKAVSGKLKELEKPIDVTISVGYDLEKFQATEIAMKNFGKRLSESVNGGIGANKTAATPEKKGGWLSNFFDQLWDEPNSTSLGATANDIDDTTESLAQLTVQLTKMNEQQNARIKSAGSRSKSLTDDADETKKELAQLRRLEEGVRRWENVKSRIQSSNVDKDSDNYRRAIALIEQYIDKLKEAQQSAGKFTDREMTEMLGQNLSGKVQEASRLVKAQKDVEKATLSEFTKQQAQIQRFEESIRRIQNVKAKIGASDVDKTSSNYQRAIAILDDYIDKLETAKRKSGGFTKREMAGMTGQTLSGEIAEAERLIRTERELERQRNSAAGSATRKEKEEVQLKKAKIQLAKEEVNLKKAKSNADTADLKKQKEKVRLKKEKVNLQKKLNREGSKALNWGAQFGNQLSNWFSLYSIERFVRNLYTVGGEFQKQQIALRSMIGDYSKADTIFERVKDLSVKSPFTFSELASYTKQMAAYGIEYDHLYDTTKRLADISAGVGVDMGRLILAYGQVRSAEVLRGQELRQFTEAGVPIVAELAKKLSEVRGEAVKVGEVFDAISKRQISFEMVKDVLFDMTDPGGRFFEMQEELAKSLAGQWSNLKDAWDIMIADIAKGSNNVLTKLASTTTDLLKNWREWSPVLMAVTGAIGALTAAIKLATVAQAAWNAVSKANPWAAAARLVVSAVGAIGGWILASNVAEKSTAQLNDELDAQIQKWNENRENALRYIDTLKSNNTSEEQRVKLYKELIELYPELFKGMKMEQIMLKDTAELKTGINEETVKEQLALVNKEIKDTQDRIADIRKGEKRETSRGSTIYRALPEEEQKKLNEQKANLIKLEAKKAEIQRLINRQDKVEKITPDSSIEKYIEVYQSLGKAVKILRQGGVKGILSNPKEGTTILEYYDQLNEALKEQEAIAKKFKVGTSERTEADRLSKVYRDAIDAIGGVWDTSAAKNARKLAEQAASADAKAYAEELKQRLSEESQKWNIYKTLFDATGNEKLSKHIAFEESMEFVSPFLKSLKEQIVAEAKKFGLDMTLPELLMSGEKQLMADESIPKESREMVAKAIGTLVDAYHKENKRLKDETIKDYTEVIKASKDFAAQIADIERKLQEDLANIAKISGNDKQAYQSAYDELIKRAAKDKSEIRLKELKETFDKTGMFNYLEFMSPQALEDLRKQVEDIVVTDSALSTSDKKELIEQYNKLSEAIQNAKFSLSDLFGFKSEEAKKLERLKEEYDLRKKIHSELVTQKGLLEAAYKSDKKSLDNFLSQNGIDSNKSYDEIVKIFEDSGNNSGLKVFKSLFANFKKTESKLKGVTNEIGESSKAMENLSKVFGEAGGNAASTISMIDTIVKGVNANVQSLYELVDILDLEDTTFGKGMESFAKSSEYAAKAWESLKSGNLFGVFAGIAGSIKELGNAFGSWFGLSADYSDYEEMKARYENLISIWDTLIERKQEYIDIRYGDEALKAGKESIDIIKEEIEAVRTLGKEWLNSGASAGSHSIGVRQRKSISGEGWSQLEKAAREIGFDYESVANGRMEGLFDLTAEQLAKLQEQAPLFWAELNSEVRDYLQQIIDSNAALEETIDLLNEAITGISFDSFYDGFVSTLQNMNSSSKDFADNFEEYLKNAILSSMVANQYRGRIEELYDKWVDYSDSNKDNEFDLTKDEADYLKDFYNSIAEDMIAERERLQQLFGWSEGKGGSSLSKSIQGVTEETADLLGSYMNAIRADVSVNRALFEQLVGIDVPKMSYLAEAQLQQLRIVVENTKRNADAADKIYDLVNRVVDKGSNKLKV